jgi:hypothetical protein
MKVFHIPLIFTEHKAAAKKVEETDEDKEVLLNSYVENLGHDGNEEVHPAETVVGPNWTPHVEHAQTV